MDGSVAHLYMQAISVTQIFVFFLIYLMGKRKQPLEESLYCKPAYEELLVRIRFWGREGGR